MTPYLCAKDAAAAIAFYQEAFGATETSRMSDGGKVAHAELAINGASIFLSDEYPEIDVLSPQSLGGSPVTLHLTVPDVDAMVERAVAAGAQLLRPVADQFHGHRNGKLKDPFGHIWMISTPLNPKPAQPAESMRAGFHTVTPYLLAQDVDALVDFVKHAFDAVETFRTRGSAGGFHIELQIGDSMVMIGGGGNWSGAAMPAMLHLYVPDVNAVYRRALAAGGSSIMEPADQPDGDRRGGVQDQFGNMWYIATTTHDVA
jgi:PhnB protein